jgi:glycosyltransferase involved in cell wall biosynthesis
VEREPAGGPSGYTVLRTPDPFAAMHEMIGLAAPTSIVVRAPDPAERIAVSVAAAGAPRLHIYFVSGFFSRDFPSPRNVRNLRYAANSPFLARVGAAMLAAEVALVPPVIEPDQYRCVPTGDAILFVNPTAIKGVHIATAIARRMPHRRFVFAKSWPDHPNHRHYEPHLPNIEWAPTTDDMRPLLERTKLLLVPSVWEESSARTIGEAQVSGIPTIASDRGGMRESIGRGGAVVPLGAPIEQWCEAIERAFTDPAHFAALREGARAHAARPDYQPAAVVDRFLEFVSS